MKQEKQIGNTRHDFVTEYGIYDVVVLRGMGVAGVNEATLKMRVEQDIKEGRFRGL